MSCNFPTLYKKTSTGAIQQWKIEATQWSSLGDPVWGVIRTRFGQVGGKIQETEDVIKNGKNVGRSNETTAVQQAEIEAEAKWLKQKKKGYVEVLEDAQSGKLDKVIEGGISPMLAHKFKDHGHKIVYPAYAQPKLDGIRCIAVIEEGKCTLWTRTRKPIFGVPHIQRALEQTHPKGTAILDGELYVHIPATTDVVSIDIPEGHVDVSAKALEFEKIVSFVRQETPKPGHEIVEYHIYDIVNDDIFANRALKMLSMITKECSCIKYVPTTIVRDETELMECFAVWTEYGYEGAIVRNSSGLYVNKRSYDLQKVKEFQDCEFNIVGIEEGRGKLQGHASAFICDNENGKTFKAKMKGELSRLKAYFQDHSLWKGKRLTVRYQNLTADGLPRFPVGISIRDYE